jgi:hypothetical protein
MSVNILRRSIIQTGRFIIYRQSYIFDVPTWEHDRWSASGPLGWSGTAY